ncbi:hypothetical protein Tco_1465302 [Tanacetum coccineum]
MLVLLGTTTARTTDDGEVEITASIDGQVKTITEASLRRHLKLEDSDGITSLPNTEIFEKLALMGLGSVVPCIRPLPCPMIHALLRITRLGSDEGSLQQNELMDLVTKLTDRVEVLENEIQQTKKDEDAKEDSSKQERKISKIDKDPLQSHWYTLEQDME